MRYSKVPLFDKVNSRRRDALELQKEILEYLNGLEETPDIRTHEDGHEAIGQLLKKVEAFIYVDHVLGLHGFRYLLVLPI